MTSLGWWLLVVIGVLLMISEVLITAFVFLWFGIGFVVAGIVTYFIPSLNWGVQLLIAALVGCITLFIGRRYCTQSDNAEKVTLYTFDGGVGQLVIRDDHGTSMVSVLCHGTYWSVANPQVMVEFPQLVNGSSVRVKQVIDNKVEIEPL
ncbi:NfeD family protein [Celerinatantimonas yamalensis]|uniref:NfeD family protein n=1 Tax=Celerinatantimonas yamalensis TaxID=559956 RepID=A0ABW9G664_9GAMM